MIIAKTLAWYEVKGEIKFPLHVGKKIYSLALLQPELLLFQKKKKKFVQWKLNIQMEIIKSSLFPF